MSATERLRAMLDERGVEWEEEDGHTLWYGESIHHAASAFSSFLFGENERVHLNAMVTPEQAIEATLGHAYEPPLAAHWDGDTLTLTIPRDPSCIRVQRSAEQPCKVYADESKVIAATLGRGECRLIPTRDKPRSKAPTLTCSECGWWTDRINDRINYCPSCGKRVKA